MDQFYLENAALYQTLVKGFRPPTASKQDDAATEEPSTDMLVSARVRPLVDEDFAAGFPCAVFPRESQDGLVDIHDLYNHPRGRPVLKSLKSFNYRVDSLFGPQTTTEEIYEKLVLDLIPVAWTGGIGTLFAYGQTGSGKTFTISRIEQLVAETLTDGSLDGELQVYFTIVELAGNSAYDLLSSRKPVSVLEDSFGVTQLAGAEEHHVQGRDEIMDFIERASSYRQTAPTLKNGASSRSHGICRIRIRDRTADTEGLLYLVDLAGSEAARDIATHGADRMRETRDINMSLSVLKDCIRGKAISDALKRTGGLRSKQKKPHIPFRQSALTKVLKHVFDPVGNQQCKTVVIACINPSLGDVGPSKNTLRYAEMLRVAVPKVDDTKGHSTGPSGGSSMTAPDVLVMADASAPGSRTSSRLLTPLGEEVPFTERIQPGMVVSWKPSFTVRSALGLLEDDVNLVAILCPDVGAGQTVATPSRVSKISDGRYMDTSREGGDGQVQCLCALVTPGTAAGAYELNLWRQVIIPVEEMEKEVILEYDTSTRYYYVSA